MTGLELALSDLITAPTPHRLAVCEEFHGPGPLFDPRVGFSLLKYRQENVYSLRCRSEILLPYTGADGQPTLINDIRVAEIALCLIQAAMQETAESQSDGVYMAISRLVLERSFGYYSPVFKAGLFDHHLRAQAFDEVMRRIHKVPLIAPTPEQDAFHLEQITLFVLTHEVTHYFFREDPGFATAWQEFAQSLVEHLHSLWDVTHSPATFQQHALRQRLNDLEHWRSGKPLSNLLEETLCDASAMLSLVNALKRRGTLREKLSGMMLSCWATIAASWLIAMVHSTTHDLMTTGTANATLALNELQERSTVAILLMANIAGEALQEEAKAAQGAIIEAWRAQPDFEELILTAFNSLFSEESLEQILVVGDSMLKAGVTTPPQLDQAILKHFGWDLTG